MYLVKRKMNKDKIIKEYGEAEYKRRLESNRQWREEHPEEVIANHQEHSRKGGSGYKKYLKYEHTGLRGERNNIRRGHAKEWYDFKVIIAPESQIHHEWTPKTSEYRGVALVETDQHQYGIVDVIRILGGKITLFTEKEIREQEA